MLMNDTDDGIPYIYKALWALTWMASLAGTACEVVTVSPVDADIYFGAQMGGIAAASALMPLGCLLACHASSRYERSCETLVSTFGILILIMDLGAVLSSSENDALPWNITALTLSGFLLLSLMCTALPSRPLAQDKNEVLPLTAASPRKSDNTAGLFNSPSVNGLMRESSDLPYVL